MQFTAGHQRLELRKHLFEHCAAEGSTAAHALAASDQNPELAAAPEFKKHLHRYCGCFRQQCQSSIPWIQPGEGSARTRIQLLKQQAQLAIVWHPREQCFQTGQACLIVQALIVP